MNCSIPRVNALFMMSLALTGPVSAADTASSDPGHAGDSGLIDPAHLLSLVQQDWNNDGVPDKALLVQHATSDPRVGLRIYLSDKSTHGFSLAARHDAIGWAGPGAGGRPMLSASRSGVTLRSGNGPGNRTPWHEVLSIDHQDQRFVVSRYTITWHDKGNLSAGFRCDINLRTGTGVRNTRSLDNVPSSAGLNQWQRDLLPDGCRINPDGS